jgi:mannose-6-phosphate isomerase-like protein (cupin superfamily)
MRAPGGHRGFRPIAAGIRGLLALLRRNRFRSPVRAAALRRSWTMTADLAGDVFGLADVERQRRAGGRAYHEFLRVPALSAGVYRLEAGEADRQQPHSEDEVYYVIEGAGVIEIAGQRRAVAPGDTVYVARGVEHRFHDYANGLTLLVVFAPPEGSRTRG